MDEQVLNWHAMSSEKVMEELEASENGLTSDNAKARLEKYGENKLKEERKTTPLEIFINQFKSILILILIIATAVSFAIGEITDALAILVIVLLNAFLGFYQEYKAEKALEALKKMLSDTARVIRDGKMTEIDSALLVPGEITVLERGDRVPADIYLVEFGALQVDESSLTGESVPVNKIKAVLPEDTSVIERKNMAFMGTVVTNGQARGVVVATGMQTEFGKIAKLTQEIEDEETPLKKRLNVLGKRIGQIALAIAVAISILGILQQREITEMFLVGISLAVAAIPEGLPAVVTMTLALGIRNLVKRKCLIRQLMASETLGATSVICTDKTGTLTKNEMTVQEIFIPDRMIRVTGEGYEPKGEFLSNGNTINPKEDKSLNMLLTTGILCNHAVLEQKEQGWTIVGGPTEGALVVAANKAKIFKKDLKAPVVTEFSFNSERKRMTVVYGYKDKNVAYVKGAPESLLERSTHYREDGVTKELKGKKKDEFTRVYEEMAAGGLRVLAFAYRDLPADKKDLNADEVEKELIFVGFSGILDPPRPEVKGALSLAKDAGIEVIIMTGDAALTTKAVAQKIGFSSKRIITGKELDRMSEDELKEALQDTRIFARVSPSHKLRVVKLLRERGAVTAMTGDGVNDAPALKKASIGVAMGIKGTDVAKEASDMILMDDNFASIVSGVEEGRRQYDNIQKFTRYLLSSNFGEIIAIAGAMLLGFPLILLPVQILWMNLVTDGMIALALGMEPQEKDVMRRKPRDPEKPILTRHAFLGILGIGAFIAAATIFVFTNNLNHIGLDKARTLAFTGIIVFEKINVFNFRSFKHNLLKVGLFSNPYLIGAWVATISLQIAVVYLPFFQNILHTVPLEISDWIMLFLLGLPVLIAGEIYKFLRRA
ncbi:MAG: calcium-translocating P-type ATPase, SERCA-type [Candidatus Zixiibacteriota bacterium]